MTPINITPTLPNLLLMTRIPYNYVYGTGVQLSPLIERYGRNIVWYSLRAPILHASKPVPNVIEYSYGTFLASPSRLKKSRSLVNHTVWALKLGKDAAKLGKKHNARVVWAYLHPPLLVAAWAAAKLLSVPLAVVVYDDPLALLAKNPSDSWFLVFAKWWFPKLLRNAKSRAVIGDAMAEYYHQKYGVDSSVLIVGSDDFIEQRPLNRDSGILYVGSVGKMWTEYHSLWQQLLDAVRILNTRDSEVRIKILRIGELDSALQDDDLVEVTGYLAEDDFPNYLERIDIGFVALPFNETSVFSSTSYPSRITSLVRSQRPFVALGPRTSTAVKFVEHYGCGLTCTSQQASDLARTIHQLIYTPTEYENAQIRLSQMKSLFSKDNYFRTFEQFIWSALHGS